MYDFSVTVTAKQLYEVLGSKVVTEHDLRDGTYNTTIEVKARCTDFAEVVQYIRDNPDVTIKQVVEMKDMTEIAKTHARGSGGYKD